MNEGSLVSFNHSLLSFSYLGEIAGKARQVTVILCARARERMTGIAVGRFPARLWNGGWVFEMKRMSIIISLTSWDGLSADFS